MTPERRQFLIGGAAAAALAALPRRGRAAALPPLQVVATTGMIADTARRIGGAAVEVQALMGPGVDPHGYRQTRSDIVAMTRAGLVLSNGLDLEAQMQDFFAALGRRQPVEEVTRGIPRDLLIAPPGFHDRHDPHVWMDPELWALAGDGIAGILAGLLPEGEAQIAEGAEAFRTDMRRLTAYAAGVLATVPEPARVLVTAHDAFGYFGRAYGFEVVGIQGISTESEAGLNRVAELVDLLVERRVGAVFVESSVSDRNVRALIEGAAARGHDVAIGGQLYSDAMGAAGSYEGTYQGMIDHNVTTIARGLGGTPPERGMDGRLTETG